MDIVTISPEKMAPDACRLCDRALPSRKDKRSLFTVRGSVKVKHQFTLALEDITTELVKTTDDFTALCRPCTALLEKYYKSVRAVKRIAAWVKQMQSATTAKRLANVKSTRTDNGLPENESTSETNYNVSALQTDGVGAFPNRPQLLLQDLPQPTALVLDGVVQNTVDPPLCSLSPQVTARNSLDCQIVQESTERLQLLPSPQRTSLIPGDLVGNSLLTVTPELHSLPNELASTIQTQTLIQDFEDRLQTQPPLQTLPSVQTLALPTGPASPGVDQSYSGAFNIQSQLDGSGMVPDLAQNSPSLSPAPVERKPFSQSKDNLQRTTYNLQTYNATKAKSTNTTPTSKKLPIIKPFKYPPKKKVPEEKTNFLKRESMDSDQGEEDLDDDDEDETLLHGEENAGDSSNEPNNELNGITLKQTAWAMNCFMSWASANNIIIDFLTIEPAELNSVLRQFYGSVRTTKGELYGISSFISLRAGLNRYMNEPPINRPLSLMRDAEFRSANNVFNGIVKKIRKEGNDRSAHHPALSQPDIEILRNSYAMNPIHPRGLQNRVWFDIQLHFGRRGKDGNRNLKPDSFVVKTDESGAKFVTMAFMDDCHGKRHKERNRQRDTQIRQRFMVEQPNSAFCPVRLFERYVSLLPDDPVAFYLRAKSIPTANGPWYVNSPLGVNQLGSMLPRICKEAGTSIIYTNYCLRSTIQQMSDTEARKIMAVSGQRPQLLLQYVPQPATLPGDAVGKNPGPGFVRIAPAPHSQPVQLASSLQDCQNMPQIQLPILPSVQTLPTIQTQNQSYSGVFNLQEQLDGRCIIPDLGQNSPSSSPASMERKPFSQGQSTPCAMERKPFGQGTPTPSTSTKVPSRKVSKVTEKKTTPLKSQIVEGPVESEGLDLDEEEFDEDEEEDEPTVIAEENRHANLTSDELDELENSQNELNQVTQKQTAWAMKAFSTWATVNNITVDFLTIEKTELNSVLAQFYGNVLTNKGELYGISSFIGLRAGMNRYLNDNGRTLSLMRDSEFRSANTVFNNIVKRIRKEGRDKSNHHPALSLKDIDILKNSYAMSPIHPTGLQNKVWFDIQIHFGCRGKEGSRHLMPDSFVVKIDENGNKFVTMSFKEDVKNHKEALKRDRQYRHRFMFAQPASALCPVRAFEKYVSLLPANAVAFYLRAKSKPEANGPWYINNPLGVNHLSSMLPRICKEAGMKTIYTNYSLKSTIRQLSAAGLEARQIMAVSGQTPQPGSLGPIPQPTLLLPADGTGPCFMKTRHIAPVPHSQPIQCNVFLQLTPKGDPQLQTQTPIGGYMASPALYSQQNQAHGSCSVPQLGQSISSVGASTQSTSTTGHTGKRSKDGHGASIEIELHSDEGWSSEEEVDEKDEEYHPSGEDSDYEAGSSATTSLPEVGNPRKRKAFEEIDTGFPKLIIKSECDDFDIKRDCLLCGYECEPENSEGGLRQIGCDSAYMFKQHLENFCGERQDPWIKEVAARLSQVMDVKNANARYHVHCYNSWSSVQPETQSSSMMTSEEEDEALRVIISRMTENMSETWTTSELYSMYLDAAGTRSRELFVSGISDHFGEELVMLNMDECDSVVGFKASLGKLIKIVKMPRVKDEEAQDG